MPRASSKRRGSGCSTRELPVREADRVPNMGQVGLPGFRGRQAAGSLSPKSPGPPGACLPRIQQEPYRHRDYGRWLAHSPPTKAIRVQSPAGSLVEIVLDDAACRRVFSGDSHFPRPFIPEPLRPSVSFHVMSGALTGPSWKASHSEGVASPWYIGPLRVMPPVGGFLGALAFSRPCILAPLHAHLVSSSSALKTSPLSTDLEEPQPVMTRRDVIGLSYRYLLPIGSRQPRPCQTSCSPMTRAIQTHTCLKSNLSSNDKADFSGLHPQRGGGGEQEKTRQPAESSGTIPTCENPGVTRPVRLDGRRACEPPSQRVPT
ncbi:hypothetical protein PR048_022533 [Dryococelus australis]|uniref:Uncharacterized protein n=1 Tax=Dryococelus australis TaxID=614101 RepID=A0ABQ9H189_9NEOP|nr:hypothetical protein PR048_022533 [Dryococelus australis]